MRNRLGHYVFSSVAALALVACGGGGSSGGALQQATTYPIQAAITSVYKNGLQATLPVTGTVSNGTASYAVTGSLTLGVTGATNSSFNGASALQVVSTVTGALVVNGQSVPLNSASTDYLNAAYAPLGSSSSDRYCVATSFEAFPTTATAGQTGNVATYACYTDSSKTTSTGSTATTFIAAAGANNALSFQFVTTVFDASNKVLGVERDTYSITTAGVLTLAQVTLVGSLDGIAMDITAR